MSGPLVLHKNRVNIITVNVGMDITGDTLTSQIREFESPDSELLVDWDLVVDDAANGLITLTADLVSNPVTKTRGFMDIKRVSGSAALPMFNGTLVVEFRGTVTE